MNTYEIIFEKLQEDVNNDLIIIENANKVNDLAYRKYVTENEILNMVYESFYQLLENSVVYEKETDHIQHMNKKEVGKYHNNFKSDTDINKKYIKNPEKADLYYKGKELLHKKGLDENKILYRDDYNAIIHPIKHLKDIPNDKDTALRMLDYMKKHSNMKDAKECKRYDQAFKLFCNKFDIKQNSSLYIRYNPPHKENLPFMKDGAPTNKGRLSVVEWPEGGKIDKKSIKDKSNNNRHVGKIEKLKEKIREKKFMLPKGYSLIHRTGVNGIKVLKPTMNSTKYLNGNDNYTGQYHPTGRVYFSLVKKDVSDDKTKCWGGWDNNHVYKLVQNINEFYIDGEGGKMSKSLDEITIDDLVNKPVYVKTNVPLKVKQVK